MDVCISPHLPRSQVIEIKALSIRKNFFHQSDIDVEEKILFRVELKATFSRAVQIPMTKANSFLRIFEAIPGTLKHFETL